MLCGCVDAFFFASWGGAESSPRCPIDTDEVASVLLSDIAKLIAKAKTRSDRNMIFTRFIFVAWIISYSQYRNFTFTNVENSVGVSAPQPCGMPSQFDE